MVWASHIYHNSRKYPTYVPTAQSDGNNSQLGLSLFQEDPRVCQADRKLTSTNATGNNIKNPACFFQNLLEVTVKAGSRIQSRYIVVLS